MGSPNEAFWAFALARAGRSCADKFDRSPETTGLLAADRRPSSRLLIDDQQLRLHQRLDLAMQPILIDGLGQLVSQVGGRCEVDAVFQLTSSHA